MEGFGRSRVASLETNTGDEDERLGPDGRSKGARFVRRVRPQTSRPSCRSHIQLSEPQVIGLSGGWKISQSMPLAASMESIARPFD